MEGALAKVVRGIAAACVCTCTDVIASGGAPAVSVWTYRYPTRDFSGGASDGLRSRRCPTRISQSLVVSRKRSCGPVGAPLGVSVMDAMCAGWCVELGRVDGLVALGRVDVAALASCVGRGCLRAALDGLVAPGRLSVGALA